MLVGNVVDVAFVAPVVGMTLEIRDVCEMVSDSSQASAIASRIMKRTGWLVGEVVKSSLVGIFSDCFLLLMLSALECQSTDYHL